MHRLGHPQAKESSRAYIQKSTKVDLHCRKLAQYVRFVVMVFS